MPLSANNVVNCPCFPLTPAALMRPPSRMYLGANKYIAEQWQQQQAAATTDRRSSTHGAAAA